MSKDPKAFPGIEALRFFCSFAVLLWHYQHFFFAAPGELLPSWDGRKQPLFAILRPLYEQGHLAVEIFWAISGFIFFWKYAAVLHSRDTSFRKFWVWRFSRLYPLHLATLLFVAVGQGLYRLRFHQPFVYKNNDGFHFVLNLFYASWWGFSKSYTFNGPSWSVSVELFAYLIFFLVASSFRFSPGIVLAFFVGALAMWKGQLLFERFAECLTEFLLGGILYGVTKWLATRPRAHKLVAQISGFVVVAFLAISYRGPVSPDLGHGVRVDDVVDLIFAPALLLVVLLAFPTPRAESSRRFIESLGDLTYASYLIHFPIQLMLVFVTDSMHLSREVYYQPYMAAIFLVTTLVAARFVFRYFEMPAQDFCRKWLLTR